MIRHQRLLVSTGFLLASALLWLTPPTRGLAQELYRYRDAQGNPVITSTLPDEALKSGYKVLDSSGRVLKTVPPAPTQEELDKKAREKERQKAEAAARQQQHKRDSLLLRNFSSPDDAVQALHRKMQELNSLIKLKQGNVALLKNQLQNQQEKAANAERAGKNVPESVIRKIQSLQTRLKSVNKEITGQRADIGKVRRSYIKKIERLEKLTGKKRTLPIDLSTDKADTTPGQ